MANGRHFAAHSIQTTSDVGDAAQGIPHVNRADNFIYGVLRVVSPTCVRGINCDMNRDVFRVTLLQAHCTSSTFAMTLYHQSN